MNDLNDIDDLIDFSLFVIMGYAGYEALTSDSNRSERQRWVRELNLSRDTDGFFALNFEAMQKQDPEHFFKITRMKPATFDLLRILIEPELEKHSWRKPISPSCRLFLVLLYFSHGVPRQVLAWMFRMGYSTVGEITYECCDVLLRILTPLYLSPPSEENWKQIAEDFYKMWSLPNCVSAIDGKHINIRCPPRAGSEFYNYKGHHSIVLLAACDANNTFTSVDIGAYGSQSDGGIFADSAFGKKLIKGELNLPPPAVLPNSSYVCNYFLVGDAAFPLRTYLMRPYPGRLLNDAKYNFNKRLSCARRVIENAFGILVARWRILQTTLNVLPDNADRIVKACVVLHNFVKLNDAAYCSPDYVDKYDANDEGHWRTETQPLSGVRATSSNHPSREAFKMRDSIKEYLYQHKI